MVFNGAAVRLIKDGASGTWKASSDSALRIEKLTLTDWTNGDNDNEYWKVTTLDGTQYFFGRNRRYAGDPKETKSTLTVPVFGNDGGEPCYVAGSYANSWCSQAYRWNLDYVVDPRGNSMTYFYSEFIGNYGRNNNSAVSAYDITSPLDRIEYGTRAGSEGSSPAPMRVLFVTDDRCEDPCGPADYPDTPLDKMCATSQRSCPDLTSPVFFTPYRLAEITTQVRNQAAGQYRDVHHWQLQHTFPSSGYEVPPAGPDTDPNLWLASITQIGHLPDGNTELTAPVTTFGGTTMANIVSWGDDVGPPYNHYRLTTINNGEGGETRITYSPPECPLLFVPQADVNPNRCYSAKFARDVTADPDWELFHKYVVTEVRERDLTDASSADEIWAYSYSAAESNDPTLWHHDYNETLALANRTWSQWVGYPKVTVTHGPAAGPKDVTTTLYHRGMAGDAFANGDFTGKQWGLRAAAVTTPLGVLGRTAALSGTGGTCLQPAGTGNGSAVRTAACTGAANQEWRRDESETIVHTATGKCLDPASPSSGAALQLWDCLGGPDQHWQIQSDGGVENRDSGLCLTIPGSATGTGVGLTLTGCNGAWNQVFTPTGNGAMLNPQSRRCADLFADGTANGTQVVTWICNNDANQQWQQQSNNTWKNPISNRCLDIVGGGTAAGTFVQLLDCTASAGQIWIPQADGTLKNPNANRCLDTGANPSSGQRLRIADCNASSVTQQWVAAVADRDGLAGTVLEQRTMDGGTEVATTYRQYAVTQTASRAAPETGGQVLTALMTTATATRSRAKKADGSWRWTESQTDFDGYGLPIQARDLGDTSTSSDDTCASTAYARNTSAYLIDFPATTIRRAGTSCVAGTRLGEGHTYYDASTTLGAAPNKGLPTKTETLISQGTSDVWASTEAGYDSYGRVTSGKDARGQTTTTTFSPATGGPVLQTTVTNPLGHATVVTTDGHRGLPVSVADPNGKTTTIQYDALGRVVSVRAPGHPATDPPDMAYVYTPAASGTVLTTKKLGPGGNQIVAYQRFDGRLRPRQSQRPGPQANGGRIITDTVYDGRGLAAKTSTFWTTGAPSATQVSFADSAVPTQTRLTADNLGRVTASQLWSLGTMKWQTTTAYPGADRVERTPPTGGIPITTISDALGRTTELRQHLGATTAATYQSTGYSYDQLDRLTQMVDPAGNTWSTTYDVGGRVLTAADPDKGTTQFGYSAAGDLTSVTDARGTTLSYKYDILGRKTELWQGAVGTGTKRASWDYDTLADGTSVKGPAVRSTRWLNGEAYSSEVTQVDGA
jgi:YD repeat-containing protein